MARTRGTVKKRRGNVVTVNFKGVEGRILLPENQYHVRVAEVTQEDGQKDPYLKWKFEVVGGKFNGKPLYNNTSLSEQSLWSLRNLLETIGVEIPNDEMELELEDYVGKELLVTVTHEEYEGRARPRITDFAPLSEEEEDEPKGKEVSVKDDGEIIEDDEDEPKSRKKSRRRADDDEEDEEAPRKSRRRRDDEEDEAPRKGGKSKSRQMPTAEEISDMSEDELEDLVEKQSLDIDLSKFKTLTKKQNAVADAIEDLAA